MEPIPDEELVARIHCAQYGQKLKVSGKIGDDLFFRRLSAFAGTQKMQGGPSVTVPTIRNWLGSDPPVPKHNGRRFLLSYIKHLLRNDASSDVVRAEDLAAIGKYLAATLPEEGDSDGTPPTAVMEIFGAGRIQRLVNYTLEFKRSIAADFFRDADPASLFDFSYYLMYRHSTNHGDILKSFLVVKKADPRVSKHFAFNHFIWGGHPVNKHIFRECEGVILKFEKSYYLIGYNFVVKADKRRYPKQYADMRDAAKETPNGMGVLSVEYGDVDASPGLFPGLTITLGAGHQPVMARAALLHIGTRSGLGCQVSDVDVLPDEIQPNRVAGDLMDIVGRLGDMGAAKLGADLRDVVVNGKPDRARAAKLADRIVGMIDNLPAWEKTRRRRKGDPELRARGAIESYGERRPRD
jgi:hypothetical protein